MGLQLQAGPPSSQTHRTGRWKTLPTASVYLQRREVDVHVCTCSLMNAVEKGYTLNAVHYTMFKLTPYINGMSELAVHYVQWCDALYICNFFTVYRKCNLETCCSHSRM